MAVLNRLLTLLFFIGLVTLIYGRANGQEFITTVAGGLDSGATGTAGPATNVRLISPSGICIDKHGNIIFSDRLDCRIRKVDISGIITTIAGSGNPGSYSGDGGPADSAKLFWQEGVAVDSSDNIYIADCFNNVIRKVKDGIIYTIAGTGAIGDTGEGGPATNALLWHPSDVGVDNWGNVYFNDQNNSKLKKIDASGLIHTIAGTGIAGYSGDGGLASAAQLNFPEGIGIDDLGNIYIADILNNRIRKVDATSGIITTVAGIDSNGFSGDGGPATNAAFSRPTSVKFDHSGNMYITDLYNFRIRKVDTAGIVNTVAGNGISGYSGDCIPALNAEFNLPQGVAADDSGNVYIGDYNNGRVRKVSRSCPYLQAHSADLDESGIQIYPNPADRQLSIYLYSNSDGYIAEMNNLESEKIISCKLSSPTTNLDMSGLQEGIYFLVIRSEKRITVKKVILIH